MIKLLAVLTGLMLVAFSPALMSPWLLLCLLVVIALLCLFRHKPLVPMLLCFLLAVLVASGRSHWAMRTVLDTAADAQRYRVVGLVVGMPEVNLKRQKFELRPTAMFDNSGAVFSGAVPRRLSLSLYHGPYGSKVSKPGVLLRPGNIIDANVLLKRPRGLLNPGGFDYQSYLLSAGIDATGYVRKLNSLTAAESADIRWQLQQLIDASGLPNKRFMAGLLLGDRSGLDAADWQLLKVTGTTHLLAISGLHIGLIALVAGMLGQLLGRLALLWPSAYLPSKYFAVFFSIAAALLYSYLSGFSIPTQRALIMLLALQGGVLWLGALSIPVVFLMALIGVMLLDPFAGSQMGLSLSFSAVLALLYGFTGRAADAGASALRRYFGAYLKSQLLVLFFMLPVLFSLALPLSLLAPLSNLIAIPVLGFILLPCLLLGTLEQIVFNSSYFWRLSDLLLTCLFDFFRLLQSQGDFLLWSPWPWSGLLLAVVSLILLLLFLPAGISGRYLALISIPLFLWPGSGLKNTEQLEVMVLDVGQGLAVVIRRNNSVLIYDTGPYFSPQFNAGSHLIVPFLRYRGVTSVERMIVSHSDNDHSGGIGGVLSQLPVKQLVLESRHRQLINISVFDSVLSQPQLSVCQRGQRFSWRGLKLTSLWPPAQQENDKNNNRSCVLRLEFGGFSMLLTGDIEQSVEQVLIKDGTPVDVLLAPHHGSKSSSGPGWIAANQARWVVISAAYNSRYGHPHGDVLKRYRDSGAEVVNTASAGAIQFLVEPDGRFKVSTQRGQRRRFYH